MIDEKDFIIREDRHKLYKMTCDNCGADRGYLRKSFADRICMSCAQLLRFKLKGNPKKGVCSLSDSARIKFRKKSYDNVDYSDRIKLQTNTGNIKKYRMKCVRCGADRGYQRNLDALRLCVSCRDKNNTFYTKEHKRVRCAIKANLVARLKNRLINKNKKSTFNLLSFSIDELKAHLESKFQPGMTWDNYGNKYGVQCWEIDHIKPDSWFNYSSIEDEDFKKCWSLDNLQPLWAKENRSKGNRSDL